MLTMYLILSSIRRFGEGSAPYPASAQIGDDEGLQAWPAGPHP